MSLERISHLIEQTSHFDADEPILQPQNNRLTAFPIDPKYRAAYDMYIKHRQSFWTEKEVPLQQDIIDFTDKMTANERFFVKHAIAFFAASDGIVNDNIAERFISEIQPRELKMYYNFQAAMEDIHSITYSLLIDVLIQDPVEKNECFNAISCMPCIKKKAEWAQKWTASKSCFAMRLIAFAAVEGIFFSGSFCAFYWLKQRNLLKGSTFSNVLISRDEAIHTENAILIYNEFLKHRLNPQIVHAIISEAVDIESEFITESLPCSLIGMNESKMKQYIRYVADCLVVSLGHDKIYGDSNPFPFMMQIAIDNKPNFFERRVADYNVDVHSFEKSDTVYTTDTFKDDF